MANIAVSLYALNKNGI